MADTCADEGETVAKMMEAYRDARPDCSYTEPVVVTERPLGYQDVSFDSSSSPRHGFVDYGKRVYRTVRTCPGGVANLDFHIGKQASFTCPLGSDGLLDGTGYGDGKGDIELPTLCKTDTKRYIDGPMLQVASCPANGNPCYPATGDKARFETDFDFAGRSFTRTYHSLNQLSGTLGMAQGWTHSFSERLDGATSGSPTLVTANGYYETLVSIGNNFYRAENSQDKVLERVIGASPVFWRLRDAGGEVREFDSIGRLIALRREDAPLQDLVFAYGNTLASNQDALAQAGYLRTVTDGQGRQLRFEYGSNQLLARIVKPDGSVVQYGYDTGGNLASADYGANRIKQYHYAEAGLIGDASQRHHLTGITAESGERYASFSYDAQGRAIESRVLGSPNEVTAVAYDSDTQSSVVTANGLTSVYTLQQPGLYRRITGISEAGDTRSQQYDATGRLSQYTDKRGFITQYEYVAGHRSAVIEAVGTPQQRRQEMDRDPASQRVLEVRTKDAAGTLLARTTYAYNTRGQLTVLTAHDPATGASRIATTTYCEQADVTAGTCPAVGLVLTIDGPRTGVSDTVNFTYRQTDAAGCATAPTTCAYRKGDLWKTTNALGHVSEVLSYDGAGRATSIQDANGIVTDLEYDPRGWLTARKTRGADPASELDDVITRIEYTADGLVRKLIDPDHSFTLFGYDDGQRLITVADSGGNAIAYTLNAAGERIAEHTYDTTGTLSRSFTRAFNTLGQLTSTADANNAQTVFVYDAEGNLEGSTDALLRSTGSAYDSLGRLTVSIANANAPANAPDRAESLYAYDAMDRLTRITDPKGLHTDYTYNGFGERTQLSSPDTGVTTYGYDAAGNRTTSTDARGVTTNVAYDALNRPTAISYPSDASQNVGFTHDNATSDCATGERYLTDRLSQMTDASGSTSWCYNRYGQLTRKTQRTASRTYALQYLWTPQPGQTSHGAGEGRLYGWRYPDGTEVHLVQDAQGRVQQMDVLMGEGLTQRVLENVRYHPFGGVAGWEYGNGLVHRRTADQNGRPGIIQTGTLVGNDLIANEGSLSLGYQFDAVGNLVALRDGSQADPPLRTYGYDGLDRLTEVRNGSDNQLQQGYSYDSTGNRLSRTDGTAATAYTYPAGSHHLGAVGTEYRGYDAVGNTVQIGGAPGNGGGGGDPCPPGDFSCEDPGPNDPPPGEPSLASAKVRGAPPVRLTTMNNPGDPPGPGTGPTVRTFTYNAANRMWLTSHDGVPVMQYQYNGKGEQVLKYGAGQSIATVYDEAGRWIGDYDATTGVPLQQVIWLDNLPVGLLVGSGPGQKLYYIEPDMLGTPRVVLEPVASQAVWRWDLTGEAFGDSAPNQDPDGNGTPFVFDMRFPGQRYDAATGLNYNYFRDYEAATGRYVESDPIGLIAGMNTYGYASVNPLNRIDPTGLIDTNNTKLATIMARGDISEALFYARMMSLPATQALQRLHTSIQQLMNRYPLASNRCEVVAKGIFDAMRANNFAPQYLRLNPTATRYMYVGSTRYTAPQHFAVRLGDMVFDASTGPAGMQYRQYIENLNRLNGGSSAYTIRVLDNIDGFL